MQNNSVVPPHDHVLPPDLLTVSAADRSAEYSAFLKYVSEQTGNISYAQLSILWPAVCQSAMTWLLVEHKSIDMGFAIFHPRPHRANWKELLVSQFPTLGPTLLGQPRIVKEALLKASGFLSKLLDSELLAIGSERVATWGIDIELKRSWWRAMFRHEFYKLSRLGSIEYASHTARKIVLLRKKILRTYFSYLRQIAFPLGAVKNSKTFSRGFLVPKVEKRRARPTNKSSRPVVVVADRESPEFTTDERSEVPVTDANVPQVPDLRPESPQLRVTGDQPPPRE